jgi:branched-chain amino acid transport system ATP-binding protein
MSLPTCGPLLQVSGLTVIYGGVQALVDVDLEVGEGTIAGLVGPNGAGKTTLLDAISGFIRPVRGEIIFEQRAIAGERPFRRARRGLARTFQSVELFDDLTVRQNLEIAHHVPTIREALRDVAWRSRKPDPQMIDETLSLLGLDRAANEHPASLSLGQQKLVGVARAIVRRPRLLLMDEPAAGLDEIETSELAARIRGLPDWGVTVLLVDHDMPLVFGVCERVTVLDFGSVIATGRPDEIRASTVVTDAYLGRDYSATEAR